MSAPSPLSQPLRLAVDSAGFVRRSCPVCTRDFKIGARPAENLLVQSVFSTALQHANLDELAALPTRYCPYCGHRASAEAFLTTPQRLYIEARAHSLARQLRFEQLRQAQHELGANPLLTFIAMRPAEAPLDPPTEPDDMNAVFFMCCGEDMKITSTWNESLLCHHCRASQRGGR